MPEKHLFVNSYHYRDRPDPNMRYRIASHAARYGPNGSLASKTSSQGTEEVSSELPARILNRGTPASPQSSPTTPRVRPAAHLLATSRDDVSLRQDYEFMSARMSDFCICSDMSPTDSPKDSKGKMAHAEDCSILEDYLTLLREHEMPFRVMGWYQQPADSSLSTPPAEGLVLQCLLVVGQAAIDGLNPKFKNKPSSQTLQLQQKALNAMRWTITERQNEIDDSIVVASAVMLSVAAFYADQDAYRAHHSSLQKFIELRGGFDQTPAYVVVKALIASSEISLAQHRYMATEMPGTTLKKVSSSAQSPTQAPFKVRYPTPPFPPELTDMMGKISPGLRSLASASKLSVQIVQMFQVVCKWSFYIDHPTGSAAEYERLLANTTDANSALRNLYQESMQTKRMAALLLISLPTNTSHARLERCLCLGLLNLLHSVTLRPHPIPLRDRLVTDFADLVISLNAKNEDEEGCIIWIALAVASEWRHCASKLEASPLPASHGYDAVLLSQIWRQRSKQVMDRLIAKCERLQIWEEVTGICSKFLWLRRLGTEWKQTWKEAMERRLRNMPRKRSRS